MITGWYSDARDDAHAFDFWPASSAELGRPAPLLVYVHGGAWRFGDKAMFRLNDNGAHLYRNRLLAAGCAVASINYRLSGQALFPACLHDVKAAIRFFRARAREFGIDPDRIALVGASAGGHLVQLAAFTGDWPDPYLEGEPATVSSAVSGAVSLYGVSDLRSIFADRVACGLPREHPDDDGAEWRLFGGDYPGAPGSPAARGWAAGQPIDYADGTIPCAPRPVFYLHGTADGVVPWNQSEHAHRALRARGTATGLRLVEGADHADSVFYADEAALEESISWLRGLLGRAVRTR